MVAPAIAKSGQSVLEQVGPNIIHHVLIQIFHIQ